jgi:hypothetical protein
LGSRIYARKTLYRLRRVARDFDHLSNTIEIVITNQLYAAEPLHPAVLPCMGQSQPCDLASTSSASSAGVSPLELIVYPAGRALYAVAIGTRSGGRAEEGGG